MRKSVANCLIGLTCGCLLLGTTLAQGIEPAKPQHRVELQMKVDSPWLAELPFLKEFFEQAGKQTCPEQQAQQQEVQSKPASAQPALCPGEAFERVGVDFGFPTAAGSHLLILPHPVAACPPGVCPNGACPTFAGPPMDVVRFVIGKGKECCEAGCCPASGCMMPSCTMKCGAQSPCSPKGAACACDDCRCGECACSDCECRPAQTLHRDGLIEHLIEISSERAAFEASLEAHAAFAEEREEMFSSVAELMTENAKLTAKIEFQAERDELHKQLQELATQNAHLKTEVALTEAKAKLALESAQLAMEKERLELRVAELERQARGDEGVRTARKSKTTR